MAMTTFEYKVVPAPKRGLKGKGVRGSDAKFANALQSVMNEHGSDGWEYQRTDTLPCEERQGLTGKTTTFQNMLVFRRTAASDITELQPELIEQQEPLAIAPERRAVLAAVPELETAPEDDASVDADRIAATLADGQPEPTDSSLSPALRNRVAQIARNSDVPAAE
jgi:hypothetical protein